MAFKLSMKKVKISAVSYLNTTPFIYGMENNVEFMNSVNLAKDIPSECARKLLDDEVDIGLIPVAVIPKLKESYIISDYCIGAVGAVHTVLLMSDVPLNEIESIYLDYQSRTSVALCQILCKELWSIEPEFIPSEPGFENKIEGKTAGVIIGDRTFHLEKEFNFQFDLPEEWQKLTGLPFVFAAWVANKPIDKNFIQLFNHSLKRGLTDIDKSIEESTQRIISKDRLREYLTKHIQFDLDSEKRKGMELFLSKL